MNATADDASPSISDPNELLRLGICKVPVPLFIFEERSRWASELTKVTPVIMMAQGDSEYAFYRNILVEPELEFPLDKILDCPQIQSTLLNHFGVSKEELRLDDAFCVHYNMDQMDTSGAKHVDPSHLTVNMCLEKTRDVEGSQVLFYGSKSLENVEENVRDDNFKFLVPQEEGFATIHFGNHPHETRPMLAGGRRTNIIVTYRFRDPDKDDVDKRSCYYT